MQGQSVTYTKRARGERFTEEFILTLRFDQDDDINEVMDDARMKVDAALERSRNEAMLNAPDADIPF